MINEDEMAPGSGFGTHEHRDMEALSHVLNGTLAHEIRLDNGSALRYGDVHWMSVGTGVRHSELNHSSDGLVHFLQVWIEPKFKGPWLPIKGLWAIAATNQCIFGSFGTVLHASVFLDLEYFIASRCVRKLASSVAHTLAPSASPVDLNLSISRFAVA